MTENFESMECSRSYVFSMWGKSIKVVVPLVFFLLWIWSHGSGTEGYWLCLLVMATRPWGVVASLDFSLSGKISGGILQRRCGVSKRINKWASGNSYHQSRLRSGRSMRRQKLPLTVWWSLTKDLTGRKEHLSRMALHRPLQPLPGSKYSGLPPFLPFSCQLAPH